ncbi:MAG: hypothetical protein JXQ29_06150 [Planctomycetes bacterium]|nr:hypothetical protein [Planctomycetota bacterium]
MKRVAAALLVALFVLVPGIGPAPHATAQYTPESGDYIVTGWTTTQAALYAADPTRSGPVERLHTYAPGLERPVWVGMLPDNRGLGVMVQRFGTPPTGHLLRHEPGPPARITTLASFATGASFPAPGSFACDGDGNLVLAAGPSLLVMNAQTPGTLTTLFVHPSAAAILGDMARVPRSNYEFAVLNHGAAAPYVFGVDEKGALATVLDASRFRNAASLSFDYRLGVAADNLILTWGSGPAGAVLQLKAGSGSHTTLATLAFAPVAHCPTQRDTILLLGHDSTVQEIDRDGRPVATQKLQTPSGFTPTGFEVYGSNRLHVSLNPATSPATLVFALNDPAAAKLYYVFLLSTDSIGFRVTQHDWIHLTLDPLFLLCLWGSLPGVITGAVGQLDPGGHACVTIKRPPAAGSLRGLQLFAAWVAYDRCGIFSVSETEHFVLP